MMLFFAVLFTAVLIHPDLDLLDVHDVKITTVRTQLQSTAGQLLQQAPIGFASPETSQPTILERLYLADEAVSPRDLTACSVLRI